MASTQLEIPDFVRVDQEELRTAGACLLRLSVTLSDIGDAAGPRDATAWGDGPHVAAGARFADRLHHLVRGLSREVDAAGHELRLSAEGYDWVDADAAMRLRTAGRPLG